MDAGVAESLPAATGGPPSLSLDLGALLGSQALSGATQNADFQLPDVGPAASINSGGPGPSLDSTGLSLLLRLLSGGRA